MRQEWFSISLKDGGLKTAKPPRASTPVPWIERDIENLLALNPEFLGFADQTPIRLRGERSTVSSPDQAYFDNLGRLAVVEVKKIRASLPAVAQVIGYANHWQSFPYGEIANSLAELADVKRRQLKFGSALNELLCWAGEETNDEPDRARLQKLGNTVLERIRPSWADLKTSAAIAPDGDALPCIGAPPRLIVVAKDFSDEAVEFAELLSQRMVPIELIEIEVVKESGNLYVGRRFVHRDPVSEPTWRLLRRAWELPIVRDHFVINGWADALNRESFSLSARECFDARFWLWAHHDEANITTVVPDGWYKGDGQRSALRKRFLNALPSNAGKRWVEWEFELPREESRSIECIAEVASAVLNILVPAARDARSNGSA